MAIVKKVGPPATHRCQKPQNPEKEFGIGTVWECDDCKKQYRLDRDRDRWVWVELFNRVT